MIKLNKLNKYFFKGKNNEIHVIDNTTLELPDSGLVSFLGHSGSGKTTLLNVIGGLDKASGEILYDDLRIKNYNMRKIDLYRNKNIGYVFQNYNLIQEETVYENLRIALEIIGIKDKAEVDKRIEYALNKVGMYKYRKKQALALSGGQQQRVSIARALVKKCKVIIADEPTGNLDSENTIEVMNILKKISKISLVLLVTHDQNIASFYSDYIYRVQDGKIIDEKACQKMNNLNYVDNNNIYLKDMNIINEKTNLGNLEVYSDIEESSIDLSIYFKNGNIYIDSNKPIKLIREANIKIINDNYHPPKINDIDNNDFDISWYENIRSGFSLKTFFNQIKTTFSKLFNVKKSVKFLYFSLFLLGILLAVAVIAYSNANSVDTSNLIYNDKFYSLHNVELKNDGEKILSKMFDEEVADYAIMPEEVEMNFYHTINLSHHIAIEKDIKLLYFNEKQNMFKGTKPIASTDIVISKNTADYFLSRGDGYLTYDDLIGKDLKLVKTFNSKIFKICGITSGNDQGYVYTNKESFYDFIFTSSTFDKIPSYRLSINEFSNGNYVYKVEKGRNVDNNSFYNEVLVPDELYSYLSFEDNFDIEDCVKLKFNKTTYYVVGTYSYPYKLTNEVYIFNKNHDVTPALSKYPATLSKSEYVITEGNDITGNDEIIIPSYMTLSIGDNFQGRKVVGKYTGSTKAMSYSGLLTENSYALFNYDEDTLINVTNLDSAKKIALDNGSILLDSYAKQIKIEKNIEESTILILKLLFAVLLIVVVIFVYFIMKSKMISDIYKIGVFRSLGQTRLQLIKKYLLEMSILTMFTGMLGYVLTIILYSSLIQKLLYHYTNAFFPVDIIYSLLGGLALFLIMVLFGLLPIILLLRKTPTEICSKYDI